MKKLGWIIGASLLVVAVLVAGATFWLRGQTEAVARRLTGMDIRFTDLEVRYFPFPAIVLTDLAMKKGPHALNVPRIELFPDFRQILGGKINLKKTVLQEPVVLSHGFGKGDGAGSGAVSLATLPQTTVVVNRGTFVLQGDDGHRIPVSLTAEAEKTDQRLTIQLRQAAIQEMGLQFVGSVDIQAFAPLRFTVNATKGTFNPAAVVDFLLTFGYLTDDIATRIPDVQHMDAEAFRLTVNRQSNMIDFAAETLNLDSVELRELGVQLNQGRLMALRCAGGVVDASTVFQWITQNAGAKKAMDDLLARARLKSVVPQGTIRIASLSMTAQEAPSEPESGLGTVDGTVEVAMEDLVLDLVAQNGEVQRLTINGFEATVELVRGEPSVRVKRLTLDSSRGGTADLSGRVRLPMDPAQTELHISIDGFRIFDSTLDLHVEKTVAPKAVFDLVFDDPSLKLSAGGMVSAPGTGNTDVEARLTRLHIWRSGPDRARSGRDQDAFLDRPFQTDWLLESDLSARAFVKSFRFGRLTPLSDVNFQLAVRDRQAALHASGRACGMNLALGGHLMPPSRLVTTVETRGTDVDLTSLVACFSRSLPVYLAGRLFVSGSFSAHGDTPRALMEKAEGELMMTVTRARVSRISGLDSRLGFFLDILEAARITSNAEDALAIHRGVVNANLRTGQLELDRFSLVGPLFRAGGNGSFNLSDRRLVLSGFVKTSMGTTNRLDVDRILEKEGNT